MLKQQKKLGNKTIWVYLGEDYEFGLYPERNKRPLKGFMQWDKGTIICLFKMVILALENRLEECKAQ